MMIVVAMVTNRCVCRCLIYHASVHIFEDESSVIRLCNTPIRSVEAHGEVEKLILLLLCAAVRCDRRDQFIHEIMTNLAPEVQAGLMNHIKTVSSHIAI